jgi:hypothetical protein
LYPATPAMPVTNRGSGMGVSFNMQGLYWERPPAAA